MVARRLTDCSKIFVGLNPQVSWVHLTANINFLTRSIYDDCSTSKEEVEVPSSGQAVATFISCTKLDTSHRLPLAKEVHEAKSLKTLQDEMLRETLSIYHHRPELLRFTIIGQNYFLIATAVLIAAVLALVDCSAKPRFKMRNKGKFSCS